MFDGRGVIQAQFEESRKLVDAKDHEESWSADIRLSPFTTEYMAVTGTSYAAISTLLRQTSYLGPIREPLRRVYELAGDPPRDVGTRGEYAPEVLYRNPELLESAQEWLQRFGLRRASVRPSARDDAFSLVLPAGGGWPSVNLADAGFGASQVLPLIVQGIFGENESLLVAEQPEIHLNPRLQSSIADFICHLADHSKAVLVETHSEHLLLRLRTLMAKDLVREKDVALYFVDRAGRRSTVSPIPVSGEGRIDTRDWPPGFFQDAVREALALTTEQARRSPDAS
jgi:predicted ATPase